MRLRSASLRTAVGRSGSASRASQAAICASRSLESLRVCATGSGRTYPTRNNRADELRLPDRRRRLPQVSRIGLGTNRLTDTPENRRFLEEAIAAGVNHIDTAHLYTSGESETTIGNALAPFPDDLTVATKGHYNGGGPDTVREHLATSLQRLKTDSIALYYIHRLEPEVLHRGHAHATGRGARSAGSVQNVGISEVTVEQIALARTVVPIAAVQNEYSLDEREHEEVIDYCEREGIAFVPYFPLRGGGRRSGRSPSATARPRSR